MKTMISIKTDGKIKNEAKKVAKELGLPLGTVINAYLREFIRTKEAHFSIAPQMTPYLEKVLGGVENDLKTGQNLSPAFSSIKEMDDYLDSK
jgi:addiction module RelB/DinJ family antitoxin